MAIQKSDKIDECVARLYEEHEESDVDDALHEEANGTCTTGYDNDGSTGYEIFKNGYELGLASADLGPVWEVRNDASPPVAFFFLGPEEEVLGRLAGIQEDLLRTYGTPL